MFCVAGGKRSFLLFAKTGNSLATLDCLRWPATPAKLPVTTKIPHNPNLVRSRLMSLHVFANFVTPFGTAANNRAETEGNITTLQKLLWMGETHSTVSAEAIRFALRRILAGDEETNRSWNENDRANVWKDNQFKGWAKEKDKTFIDDDLLGYMIAEAAKEEGEAGSASVRRAVLEVTRAVSLTPWAGDVTFNAASPGATPSASKGENKSKNPVPYGTEVHATRYQYGIALTPRTTARQIAGCKSDRGTLWPWYSRWESRAIFVRLFPGRGRLSHHCRSCPASALLL